VSSGDNPVEPEQSESFVEIRTSDKLTISTSETISWIKSKRIETALEYWELIVKPDYAEFQEDISDLRRAFHCAVSLFHLSDWLYVEHKSQMDRAFCIDDGNGNSRQVRDEKEFASAIVRLHPDFGLIRGIAFAAKHLKLRPKNNPHPATPTHAANVSIQTVGYGHGGFGEGPYGETSRVMLAGPNGNDLEFFALATSTVEMWKNLSGQHGWQLT
jgi:hypothetical protein